MKIGNIINKSDYRKIKNKENLQLEIKNLAFKLEEIKPKTLFFCLKKEEKEILKEIETAKKMGAVAVVTEQQVDSVIPQIVVPSSRKALAIFSSNFYGKPSDKMKIIGITGTNGKTTSTYILKSILQANKNKVGVIGTNGYTIGNYKYSLNMTTPDPIQLHQILREMLDKGCEYVCMEVSAHALYFDKIEGIKFEAGIFTNFTQDHLDFFKTLDNYAYAKSKFFTSKYLKNAIINKDDALGSVLLTLQNVDNYYSYGIENQADVFAVDIHNEIDGVQFVINLFNDVGQCFFAIPGKHNVQNVLACATCASILGVPTEIIKKGISNLQYVDGRFQIFETPNNSYAIVDYAHTPDGLEKILKSASELSKGRVIAVFGCGGNRDNSKRSIMGEIASNNSNFCIITSDNPRNENPYEIISEIEKGLIKTNNKNYKVIENRKDAIEFALNMSKPNDCVVICGKGAENYQEIKGVKYHFDDREIVQEWCRKINKQNYQNFEK